MLLLILAGALFFCAGCSGELDEEEFEGVQSDSFTRAPVLLPLEEGEGEEARAHQEAHEEARARASHQGSPLALTLKAWAFELAFGALAILYALNYVRGSGANAALMRKVHEAVAPVLRAQFSRVDLPQELSLHEWRVFCTGRRNCFGAEVHVDLLARQDLMSVMLGLFTKQSERIRIDVPLASNLDPFVFALFPSAKGEALREELPDLAHAKQRPCAVPGMTLLCDRDEVVSAVLRERVSELILKHAKRAQLLYCTDMYAKSENHSNVARFVWTLPRANKHFDAALAEITELSMYLVDEFATLKLSAASKAAAVKVRKGLRKAAKETPEELEARIQARKERKAREEMERMKKMTPEQLARFEKKMRKRNAKNSSRVKVKMMK